MHAEWLDITVNSFLPAILNVFQTLMQREEYDLVAVKSGST
jgi:hypothetical protein